MASLKENIRRTRDDSPLNAAVRPGWPEIVASLVAFAVLYVVVTVLFQSLTLTITVGVISHIR